MQNKKEEYPIDIAILCSLALGYAFDKYASILQLLPKDSKEFISVWNAALLEVLKRPEFKKHLGLLGRALLWSSKSEFAASIANNRILSVPYRSFYYAKRFTDAFNFASNEIEKRESKQIFIDVVDFGRGLSPWSHLLAKTHEFADIYTVDTSNLINDVYCETSNKLKLQPQMIITKEYMKENISPDVFVSLGTFVYLEKPEQDGLLKYAMNDSGAFYIELELYKGKKVPDAEIMKKKGAKYHPFGTLNDVKKACCEYKGCGFDDLSDVAAACTAFPNLAKGLRKATELFVHSK